MNVHTNIRNPTISVVMGVYNGESYLDEAIKSILQQSYKDFEFIIVDDGSTDNSLNIIRKYAKKDKRIISLVNKKNQGQSKTWNKAIKIAKGRYIARMDADDISLPNRLIKQITYLQNHQEIDVLGCYSFIIHNESQKRYKSVKRNDNLLNAQPPVHHPTCIIKKELFFKYGLYNPNYDNAEDYELWTRFYSNGVNFHSINDYLFLYRIHNNNVSIKKIKRQIYLQLKVSLLGIFKYKIGYNTKGYLHILEQFLYLVYLTFGIDKIYTRNK